MKHVILKLTIAPLAAAALLLTIHQAHMAGPDLPFPHLPGTPYPPPPPTPVPPPSDPCQLILCGPE